MKFKFPFLFLFFAALAHAQVPPAWDTNSTYSSGALVLDSSGNSYIAQKDVTAGTALTDTTAWLSLDAAAPTSAPATSPPTTTPDATQVASLTTPEITTTSTVPDPTLLTLPSAGDPAALLLNISTAGLVKTDANMTGGFIISGGTMQVLVTAKGSNEQGVDPLNNPGLQVVPLDRQSVKGTSTDWATGTQVSDITATGFMNGYKDTDAALLLTLTEGAYLADVFTEDSDEGGALVEVYDMNAINGTSNGSKLLDISTNGTVLAGSNPGQKMTAGFIIFNGTNRRVLITAKGSTEAGVDPLNNPRLEVVPLARDKISGRNNDWKVNDSTQISAITKSGLMAGYKDTDAAIILTLDAAAYLVDVFSEDGDSGKALVEVFDVDLLNALGVAIE